MASQDQIKKGIYDTNLILELMIPLEYGKFVKDIFLEISEF